MHADGDWQAVEGVLRKDVSTASEYRQIWKLKLRTLNTESAVLHLNSKEAKRELKVKPQQQNPAILFRTKKLGVMLDSRSRIADTSSHFANDESTRRTLEAVC